MPPRPNLLSTSTSIGCLAWLAVASAIAFWLNRHLEPTVLADATPWVAGTAGLLASLGLSNLWQLLAGHDTGDDSRGAQLARAEQGRMPDRSAPAVARGVVRATGEPLRAPVSGEACVSYSYAMFREVRTGSKRIRVPFYWGQASRAFELETPGQVVRVRAVPRLLDRPARHAGDDAVERARTFVAATRFEGVGEGLVNTMASVGEMVSTMLTDADGEFRKDWSRGDDPVDVATLLLEESLLPVGAVASVSGFWSVEEQAIVTHLEDREPEPVTATTGATETLTGADGTLPHSRASVLVTGLSLIAAAAGLVWIASLVLPR